MTTTQDALTHVQTEQERKFSLSMVPILPRRWKHLLYKDECGDDFLLTKSGEIYRYGENELRATVWNRGRVSLLQKKGARLTHGTDDGLFLLNFSKDALEEVISLLGAFRRRPSRRLLPDKEAVLGHKIYPYRPVALASDSFLDASPACF